MLCRTDLCLGKVFQSKIYVHKWYSVHFKQFTTHIVNSKYMKKYENAQKY